jgi:hypothetical protein
MASLAKGAVRSSDSVISRRRAADRGQLCEAAGAVPWAGHCDVGHTVRLIRPARFFSSPKFEDT